MSFDPMKSYRRRDGLPAKIIHTFKDGSHLVVFQDDNGDEVTYQVRIDGLCGFCVESPADLVNGPEVYVLYQALMSEDANYGRDSAWAMVHKQRDAAVNQARRTFGTKWILKTVLSKGQKPVVTMEHISDKV